MMLRVYFTMCVTMDYTQENDANCVVIVETTITLHSCNTHAISIAL